MLEYTPDEIDYAVRVSRGIALLDEKWPDWWRLLDTDTLDVQNGAMCVTAQASGLHGGEYDWRDGMDLFGLTPGDSGTYVAHGFNAEDQQRDNMYHAQEGWEYYDNSDALEHLTALWLDAIYDRRKAAEKTEDVSVA